MNAYGYVNNGAVNKQSPKRKAEAKLPRPKFDENEESKDQLKIE